MAAYYKVLSKPSFFPLPLIILLATQALLLQRPVISGEPQVPCFFVFGDSVVDNGNNNCRNTTSKVDFLPYGIDFPDGPTGRFTNGRNIADVVAELLGFERYIPPYANATNEDLLRGVNYGSGGAGILDQTGRTLYGDVISMNEQLSNHESAIARLIELFRSTSLAQKHLSKCLYYVVMGNNDYLAEYLPKLYSSSTQYSPQQYASLLINQYSKQLQRLYDDGARKIAVSGLGKLGCVPQQRAVYASLEKDSSSCIKTSNEVPRIFDEKLKILVKDLNRRLPDARFAYIGSTVSSFGNITNLTDPCCSEATGDGTRRCLRGTVPCSNRDDYIFWDEVHPSEAANLIFGKSAYKDITSLLVGDDDGSIGFW